MSQPVTRVADSGSGAQATYSSGVPKNSSGASLPGLIGPTAYQEANSGGSLNLSKTFTWATNSAGNAYIGTLATTLNPGTGSVTTSTVQTLDAYGNLTKSQVYDYGNSTTPVRTYNYTYLTDPNYLSRHIDNRLTQSSVTSPGGTITLSTISYDGNSLGSISGAPLHDDTNYGTSFTYRGNPTTVSSMGTTMQYTYMTTGIPSSILDGDGANIAVTTTTSTAYSLPSALTPNANSALATDLSYTSSFAIASVTAPSGATQTTTYDAYQRTSTVTSADGAVTTYTYTYAPANQMVASLSSPSTQWTRTTYDGFGRVVKVETGYGSNNVVTTTDTQYAACGATPLGKTSAISQPYGPGETELWTTYGYDSSCRLTSTVRKDGNTPSSTTTSTTTNAYSINMVKTTDPAGVWKTYANDAMGNLTSVTEPDPSSAPSGTLLTSYSYNAANQLVQVQMTRAGVTQTRTFAWTGSDLASSTNPENGTVTYTYDGNHHVLGRTDAKGQITQYTYDPYERIRQVTHSAILPQVNYPTYPYILQAIPTQQVNYTYDGTGAQSSLGRLTAVSFWVENAQESPVQGMDRALTYSYGYNTAGRLTSQTLQETIPTCVTGPGITLTANYTWDTYGRLTGMTYPSGTQLAYNYDAVSRLSSIAETQSGMQWTAASAFYTSANLIQNMTYGANGGQFSESRTYNNLLQLIQDTVTGASGTLMNMLYNFTGGANNGKVASTTDNVLNETVTYQYDSLNRLVSATASNHAWGDSYSFDGFGNLQSKTATYGLAPTGGGANSATNQPTGVSVDANGNTLGSGTPYNWDVENRLLSSSQTTPGLSYSYDPWGKRVWAETFTPVSSPPYGDTFAGELFFYGLGGQKLESYSFSAYAYVNEANGNLTQSFGATLEGINVYFGPGGKMLESKGAWVVTDRQGTVRANSNGETFSYFPYGEERTNTPNGREKFATYTRDGIGQDYADQRYYNSNSGAFWSPDPGGIKTANPWNPSSWNRYAFVLGDPINLTDPTGTIACDTDDDWSVCSPDYDPQAPGGGTGGGPAPPQSVTVWAPAPDPVPVYSQNPDGSFTAAGGAAADPSITDVNPMGGALQQAGQNLQGFQAGLGVFALGSAVAGTGAAGLLASSGATAPSSVLYGDIQSSFNFGASVQPTITATINNVSRVFGPTGVPGQSQLLGSWVTPEPITSSAQAISALALGSYNLATQIAQGTILSGATVVVGTASPQSGQPGGALQIFVQQLACLLLGIPCPLN